MIASHHSIAAQSGTEGPAEAPHARHRRHAEDPGEPMDRKDEREPTSSPLDPTVDPLLCQLAMNYAPASFVQQNPAPTLAPSALPLRDDLQNLLSGLVRRVAWGGDRRKGSARIELSEGALAGATLVVHAEQRSVSVELELPSGVTAQGWQERIAQRLEGKGFAARVKVG